MFQKLIAGAKNALTRVKNFMLEGNDDVAEESYVNMHTAVVEPVQPVTPAPEAKPKAAPKPKAPPKPKPANPKVPAKKRTTKKHPK